MRNAKITILVLVSLVAMTACKKEEAPSTTTQTTATTATTATDTAALSAKAAPASATTTTSAGGVTVDMRFIGLDAIADKSFTPGEAAAKTVILANHSNHMHKAMFIVSEYNAVNPAALRYLTQINGEKFYAYDLNGKQIVLDDPNSNWGDTAPVRFSSAGDPRNERFPTLSGTGQNDTSLHWVPGMGHILGGTPTPKPEYFKKEPDASKVLARMALPGGDLASQLYEPYWVWQFGNLKQVQVVADEIHYSFKLKNGQLPYIVYGRDFAPSGTPGSTTELFRIKLADPNNDTTIPIFLANIPDGDFGKSVVLKVGYKDPHFELHYEMLDGAPAFAPAIVGSFHKNPRAVGPMGVGVYCGPDTVP